MAQYGAVGVGTYATVVQFKDLDVAAGGQVLLHKSLAESIVDFDLSGGGQWKVLDHVLQQSSTDTKGMNIFTGEKDWTDYVVSVKARKITGKEGFSLGFRAIDAKNFVCLNVGGWDNTKAQFGITINGAFSEIGDSSSMKVEEDRWYEVKVDVKGDQALGFVDCKKIATARVLSQPPKPATPTRGNAARSGRSGRGGGSGAAPPTVGQDGGGTNGPLVVAASPTLEKNLWDKVIFVGSTVIITGLVAIGVMWARSRLPKQSS